MRVHAVSQAADLDGMDLSPCTLVVIDAIRASSTIVQAVANGCKRVIPVATVEEAQKRKEYEGNAGVLLCGERHGLRIDGFDLGNSPREFTAEAVRDKTIILTTTNGTQAVLASRAARETVIGAFLNLPAVVRWILHRQADVLLVPVGREGVPVLDDVVCAGMYIDTLLQYGPVELNGAAHLALMAYSGYRGRLLNAVLDSPSGQNLVRIGLESDLPYCVQVGLLKVVPLVSAGVIVD